MGNFQKWRHVRVRSSSSLASACSPLAWPSTRACRTTRCRRSPCARIFFTSRILVLPLPRRNSADPFLSFFSTPTPDANLENRYWSFGGSTVVSTNKYVRLTPDRQSKRGWLWSKEVCNAKKEAPFIDGLSAFFFFLDSPSALTTGTSSLISRWTEWARTCMATALHSGSRLKRR